MTEKETKKQTKATLGAHNGMPGNAKNRIRSVDEAIDDEAYIELRSDNRLVMRHAIALNLDAFKPATDEFAARPVKTYPTLQAELPPFLSVIVPNLNGKRHLPGLFAALASQTFTDYEVILADDGSTDGSVEFVEATYPDVRVLVNRRPLGFVANVNAAADAATGRILALLNNDTEPDPAWLEKLAVTICAHPDAAIVASKMRLFDQRDTLHTAGDMLGADGIPRNRGVWEADTGQFDALTTVFSGCGGGSAYRRDVWQSLGGFDPDFWMYVEDVDYAFRARLQGHEVVYAPDAVVYHKIGGSGGDTLASYYVGRNTIWNIVKNMPGGLLIKHLPAIIAAQVKIAADAIANIQGEAAQARLRGQLDGLLGIPKMLGKRRQIQNRRQVNDSAIERLLV